MDNYATPLRLRGGGKKAHDEANMRRMLQNWKRREPLLTIVECIGLIEDEFSVLKSKSWVSKWWKSDVFLRKEGSGGHNRITDVNRRKVVKMCAGFKRNRDGSFKRRLSAREASRECKRRKFDCSRGSVTRIMKEADLTYKTRKKAARLSKKNIEDRKKFYDAEIYRSIKQWQPVVYTDSTKFELQHDASTRNDGSYMEKTVDPPNASMNKHPAYIHVYGGLCGWGLVGPYFVKAGESITAALYSTEILPEMISDLNKLMKKLGDGYEFELQQNGAGAHFAKVTTDFLDEEKVDYWPKGHHPGNSPDLSSIENFWSVLKVDVYKSGEPKTIRSLKLRCRRFFKDFRPEACEKLLSSMPRRLEQLTANYWGRIRY